MPESGTPFSPTAAGLPTAVALLGSRRDGPAAGYLVLATSTGTGFSSFGGIALTTWESPGTPGLRIFLRDLDSGTFWSLGRPAQPAAARIKTHWVPGCFILEHIENGIRATLETCVLPDQPAELRRLTLTDLAGSTRRLEVTSLAEIVLNNAAAHAAHPAFSKLFLQTEYLGEQQTLLARRRSRDPNDHHPILVHSILGQGEVEWETDRAKFFGRGLSADRPAALISPEPLSGTTGNVLDPVVSLRRAAVVDPGTSVEMTYLLGAVPDRTAALNLAGSFDQESAIGQAFAAAGATAEGQGTKLGISGQDQVYGQALAAAILRGEPGLRAGPEVLARASGDPAGLAVHGIDAHRPLVLVQASTAAAKKMESIYRVWQQLDLSIQLVVLGGEEAAPDPGSGLIRLRPGSLTAAEKDLLAATAEMVITGPLPLLADLNPQAAGSATPVQCAPSRTEPPDLSGLRFYNGWGGFSPDGSEYLIHVPSVGSGGLRLPPRPWTNVLANDTLGCIISETGAGTTWYGNSREHRLTPWFNDPLLDPHGDAVYLRDDSAGNFFSCLPGPVPGGGCYEIRHGHGYTRCDREGDGLTVETLVFIPPDQPVRITRIRVTNLTESPRRLSLFSYSQLVLGGQPRESSRFVVTSNDPASGSLLAHNRTAGPFAECAAFCTVVGDRHLTTRHHSGDRAAFLGPAGDPAVPAALASEHLDGRLGGGLDPCFALQASLVLEPGATAEEWVLLGQASDTSEASELVTALTRPGACEEAWRQTRDFWHKGLGGIQVKTPSSSLDLMVNGWLAHQTLACRMMGRSALYQSGGAFGFRDQLQDSLALLPLWPDVARRQILLNASHQFVEGDVLHWWHPPLSRGIRTRFADDLLWLPLATVEYMKATGDQEILSEQTGYLTAPLLEPGQDEVFLQPEQSDQAGDLYDHCCRALDRSLTHGSHGLPLFGTGDWNDGMNRVGREGRGESVWMGFFLVTIIDGFPPLCRARGDSERLARYQRYRDKMVDTLNDTGWDGDWYRRGYYDDGSPLGSWENKECAIDALAQAWSVLSEVAPPARAEQVMDAVEEHLISDEERLIRLLTPPFVDTPHDPGYIKGYVAGVRENGGQYTHAAMWVIRAMAALGRRNRAAQLLELVNPVGQAATPEQVERYQVEPYVVAADVYGAPPHVGRGGWTWYTGSSGWMLRVALESILGLQPEGDSLVIAPCVPDDWPEYTVTWRVPALGPEKTEGTEIPGDGTCYEILVANPDRCSEAVVTVTCDGAPCPVADGVARVPLLRDGTHHQITITLGQRPEVLS